MRQSPAAAFAFLAATIVLPMLLGYAVMWGLLRYTNTGLLIYKREAAVAADAERQQSGMMLHCSYFTGTAVLLREFAPDEASAENGEGEQPAASCPWRIDVS